MRCSGVVGKEVGWSVSACRGVVWVGVWVRGLVAVWCIWRQTRRQTESTPLRTGSKESCSACRCAGNVAQFGGGKLSSTLLLEEVTVSLWRLGWVGAHGEERHEHGRGWEVPTHRTTGKRHGWHTTGKQTRNWHANVNAQRMDTYSEGYKLTHKELLGKACTQTPAN